MKVIVSRDRGFCAGVKAAVERAFSLDPVNTYVLGELIHNDVVLEQIAARGIVTVDEPEEIPAGATVLIRAHGVGEEIYARCHARGLNIVDCTCPFVRRTQEIVRREGREKLVVIAGTRAQ